MNFPPFSISNSKTWFSNWLDNIKFSHRILYGYAFAVSVAVLGTTSGLIIGNSYQQYAYGLREDFLEEIESIIKLQNSLLHLQKHQQQFFGLLEKPELFREEYQLFKQHQEQTYQLWSDFKISHQGIRPGDDEEELAMVEDIIEKYDGTEVNYTRQLDAVLKVMDCNNPSPEEQARLQRLLIAFAKNPLSLQLREFVIDLEKLSELGEGSTFWFDLLVWEVDTQQNAEAFSPKTIIGFREDKKKILVVDDCWSNRLIIISMLSPLGFQITEAIDGEEALQKIELLQPDLVIMDLAMPKIDGFEVIQRLRQSSQWQSLKIIASSARVFNRDQQKSAEVGADSFLPKPIDKVKLMEMLQKHLQLEWIYQQQTEETFPPEKPSETQALVLPPIEVIKELYNLARAGLVSDILDQINHLEKTNSNLVPFGNKIRQWAKAFQVKEIQTYLESLLNKR